MKKTYLKPAANELLVATQELMITASGGGEKIVDNGGDTATEGITEGDARRRRRDVWEDEEEFEEEEF